MVLPRILFAPTDYYSGLVGNCREATLTIGQLLILVPKGERDPSSQLGKDLSVWYNESL